ncbi:phosphotransferase family protein [Hamadaea tsunoensis]|uniref:phosphotransferase family protein n=1 Tax=Hamadaea tsunoensis TaxID=53368 RepID=UPI0003FDE63A|nr:phosphotransferase family protein [Hamadaea tsunoensis]
MTAPRGLDLDGLGRFLGEVVPVAGPLSATFIQGGRSNLTYTVTDGTSTWVVRRPPLGHVLSTAHDMTREFRVISALGPTGVPVPRAWALCEDESFLGAPFYVMSYVDGIVYRTAADAAPLGADRLQPLCHRLFDVLAELHGVDYDAVGLGDFGRPEGYLDRQVRRWRKQLDASHSRDVPGFVELHEHLAAAVPAMSGVAIVHGDFRLDNAVVSPADEILAVLDWEMATLGDPLADLALSLAYWGLWLEPGGKGLFGQAPPAGLFPSAEDLADHYARQRGVDLGNLGWYLGFAYFKIAVILEGIHYRYVHGQTVGTGFENIGAMVPYLVDLGHKALREA